MRRVRDHIPGRGPDGDDPDAWHRALKEARVPPRYWGATIEAIRAEKVSVWARQALREAPNWLAEGQGWYLQGNLNAGKSSLAAILLMDALKRCDRCLWLSVRDVARVRFHEGAEAIAMDDQLRACDVLVLDDLGSERFKLTSAAGGALEETVRILYDRQRTLIVTANMSWRQLGLQYGAEAEPVVSVMRRIVTPVPIDNDQWPLAPMEGR